MLTTPAYRQHECVSQWQMTASAYIKDDTNLFHFFEERLFREARQHRHLQIWVPGCAAAIQGQMSWRYVISTRTSTRGTADTQFRAGSRLVGSTAVGERERPQQRGFKLLQDHSGTLFKHAQGAIRSLDLINLMSASK